MRLPNRIYVDTHDCWIGMYWNNTSEGKKIYFCPIPFVVIYYLIERK